MRDSAYWSKVFLNEVEGYLVDEGIALWSLGAQVSYIKLRKQRFTLIHTLVLRLRRPRNSTPIFIERPQYRSAHPRSERRMLSSRRMTTRIIATSPLCLPFRMEQQLPL